VTALSVISPAGNITGPRLVEVGDELSEIRATRYPLPDQRFDGRRVLVEHHALVALARQAANHVAAHFAQSDNADLHSSSPEIGLMQALAERRP
jgi:hypothetical protein